MVLCCNICARNSSLFVFFFVIMISSTFGHLLSFALQRRKRNFNETFDVIHAELLQQQLDIKWMWKDAKHINSHSRHMDTYKDEGVSARTLMILANWNARRGELHLNEKEKKNGWILMCETCYGNAVLLTRLIDAHQIILKK